MPEEAEPNSLAPSDGDGMRTQHAAPTLAEAVTVSTAPRGRHSPSKSVATQKRAGHGQTPPTALRLTERNVKTRWSQDLKADPSAAFPLAYRVEILVVAYQAATKIGTQDAYKDLGIPEHTLRRALGDWRNAKDANRRSLGASLDRALEKLAKACLSVRRTKGEFEEFEDFGGDSAAAPMKFREWLTIRSEAPTAFEFTGRQGLAFMELVRNNPRANFQFIEGEHRNAGISRIWEHLRKTNGTKPIMCVASPGMAHGLTALAIHLADHRRDVLEGDTRPWVYLPVNRTPQVKQHGEAALVARLAAFYENKDPSKAQPGSPTETRASIALIRERIARFPAILIFDGFASSPGDPQHLLDFVGGDPLAPLLDRIMRPYVGKPGDDVNPEIFHRTRILVLGNRALDDAMRSPSSDRKNRGLNVYINDTERYPGPQAAQLGLHLDVLGLRQTHDEAACRPLFDALQRHPPGLTISDTDLRLVAAIARLHHLTNPKPLDIDGLRKLLQKGKAKGITRRGEEMLNLAIEPLCDALCGQLLEKRPQAWHALAFVALDLGGIRSTTIRRLMSVRYGETKSDQSAPPYTDVVNHQLDFLRNTLLGIVVLVPEEGRKELYADDRETEYDPVIWGDAWRSSSDGRGRNLTYDIHDADVRGAIRGAMRRHAPNELMVVERLLAEEALQQHTILARHGESGRDESLRSKERLVEAIYHGIMSVPPFRATGDGVDVKASDHGPFPEPPDLLMSLPTDPKARLRRLFTDLYCDRLERRPQWALTRSWDAVHLKGDLLALFLERMEEPSSDRTDTDFDRAVFNAAVAAEVSADVERFKHLKARFPLDKEKRPRRPYEKLVIDNLVAQNKCDDAINLCERYIKDYALAHVIDPLPHAKVRHKEALLSGRAACLAEDLMATSEFASDDRHHWGIIERVVTVRANQGADLSSQLKRPSAEALERCQQTYVLYLVLERVRDRMVADCLADKYDFGAVVTRVFARTSLLLAKWAEDEPSRISFRARARIAIDHMTRAADRFPVDRAQHLILEAHMAREGLNRLDVAAERLLEAEALLPSEHEGPIVNLRFLLERAEMFYAAAKAATRQEQKQRLRAIAYRDNARLISLAAGPYPLPVLHAQARSQRERWSKDA